MGNTLRLCALALAFALVAVPTAANERLYEQCLARADGNWNQCLERAGDDNTKQGLCNSRRSLHRQECATDRARRQREEAQRQNEERSDKYERQRR